MIINNITEHKNKKNSVILPFRKKNIFKIKINKSIEIVTVHNPGNKNFHQDNVGSKYLISTRSWDKGIYIIDIELEKGAKSQEYFTKI